jgi:ribonucleotide monophosphatase NagD (HAD superfamily)
MIDRLRKKGYNLRFVTNTDSSNRVTISKRVKSYGMNLPIDEIFTCSTAAVRFLETHPNKTSHILCSNDVIEEFKGLKQDNKNPDYVVIGDFKDKMNFENINNTYRHIMSGADIIAMQDSPYFYTASGIMIDTGAFVKMFEYASGKKAIVVGKPRKEFFEMAIVVQTQNKQKPLSLVMILIPIYLERKTSVLLEYSLRLANIPMKHFPNQK